jgi:large subunit ribosomal protein L21
VDGNTVLAKPNELENIEVNAEIVNTAKAKKINGFTYKNKSNQRRRWGHRQNYNEIKITSISRKK